MASDFTPIPGPRSRAEGAWSAEEFSEKHLWPKFQQAVEADGKLLVDLDGGYGYATSFLEEAFGGLARQFGIALVKRHVEFKSEDDPYLVEDIQRYIKEAITGGRVH